VGGGALKLVRGEGNAGFGGKAEYLGFRTSWIQCRLSPTSNKVTKNLCYCFIIGAKWYSAI